MAFTFFFRDQPVLDSAIELFIQATMGRSRIRIWDAGCAMGPEPYTLLILLAERMGRFSFQNLRLDATDIDEGGDFGKTIAAGKYPYDQLSRIPADLFTKYFSSVPNEQNMFEISTELRSRITFKKQNLLDLKAPGEGYAMIVCKNVLLHLSEEQRILVIKMFYASLAENGLLVMEHTQKLPAALNDHFKQATKEAQIYKKITMQAALAA